MQEIIPGKPYHTYIFDSKAGKHKGIYAVCDVHYNQIELSDEQFKNLSCIIDFLRSKKNTMKVFSKIASLLSRKGEKEFLRIIDSIENEKQAKESFSEIEHLESKDKDDEGR